VADDNTKGQNQPKPASPPPPPPPQQAKPPADPKASAELRPNCFADDYDDGRKKGKKNGK
jgi:hypothetical protein